MRTAYLTQGDRGWGGGWRECGGRQSKHVVITEDKINSHGGSRRADSQPVSGCSHPGSTKTQAKEGSASAGQLAAAAGCCPWPAFFSVYSRALCWEMLHFYHLPPSAGNRLVLEITIDWWLVCNLGNGDRWNSLSKAPKKLEQYWFLSLHWSGLCLHDAAFASIFHLGEQAEESRYHERCFLVMYHLKHILRSLSLHTRSYNTPREEWGSWWKGRGGLMRTYLFLSDSCRKNSVDVNERQLVLIKNLIAPQHALQR